MALSLQELRNRIAKNDEGKKGGFTRDNASFPFWDIPDNSTAILRFLPDADQDNPHYYFIERQIIRMPFAGIIGQQPKTVFVEVPCMHMFGETCPINEATKGWWKTELEETARIYYKKRSYLYQGFVVSSSLAEENSPENPIRRFVINRKLHEKIKTSIETDSELESVPFNYDDGIDYKLYKNKEAISKYANYDASSWSRKTRSLTAAERDAIEKFGLFDLKNFLPRKPDEDHLRAISEMFEASVGGEMYDESRWGKFYKPLGSRLSDDAAVAETAETVTETKVTKPAAVTTKPTTPVATVAKTTPVAAPATTPAGDGRKLSTQELIAKLKNNKNNG